MDDSQNQSGGPPHLPGDTLGEAESPMVPDNAHPEPGAPKGKLGLWRHLAISSFWFANNLHWGALGMIIIPSQGTRLEPFIHMKEAEITGWTIGMGAIVGTLVPPIVGALSDRCTSPLGRRRPYVIWGTVINLIGLALFYLGFINHNLATYIAGWMVVGLGNNIAVGAFSGIIPDVVPANERGMASSWMATQQQLGTIGGFLLGAMVLSKGRENDLLAITVIGVVLAAITAVTVAGTPERRLTESTKFGWTKQEILECFWIDPRKHPDFGWVWLTRAFFTMGWWLIQPILLYFMRDVVQSKDPAQAVSLLGAIVLVGAIPTGIAGGLISDRFGRKRIIFIAGMVMAVACLGFTAVGFLPVESRTMAVYTVAVLWGFGYGAYLSVDWALGTEVLPNPDHAGKDMGVWHLSMVVPQTFAAPLAGLMLNPFSSPGVVGYKFGGYALVFGVACVFMFLCGALIFRVKKGR
jgi:MFS family permease